ncbi:MAG: UDP-N-acetylmuramate dehydrogenase [Bacteroidales bacterium]|nr:UDP-N-acetylmuramate dehydrogenase [Bacteroidales bacterium]
MTIEHDISLKKYNTFGIDAQASAFVAIRTEQDLHELFLTGRLRNQPFLVLGGGSNTVFADNYRGLVVHMETKGIKVQGVEGDDILVEAQAGEVWSDFVRHCVDHEWYGAENLSGIPGTVGAAPVQNVGAYGTEAKDIIEVVRAYDVQTSNLRVFSNSECRFGYRNSIFKQELKDRYIVASVIFRLHREYEPNLSYKALATAVAMKGYGHPTGRQVAETVTELRNTKLPDPKVIGSAGSFFKNPVVTASQHDDLKRRYPDLVSFATDDGHYKLAAGWLIEKAGWKGKRLGNAGVYGKQALVLVNCGGCTGKEVVALSKAITADVEARFGVRISPEAIII